MNPILTISLVIFGLLFVITYLAVIGLYFERRHKEEHVYNSYNNYSTNVVSKKKPFGVRAFYAYLVGIAMIGLIILIGTIGNKHLNLVLQPAPAYIATMFSCISLFIITIGVFVWILTDAIPGPVIVNVGGVILSIAWLVIGMINFKWYIGLSIGLGILGIVLAISYLLTCTKRHNMNKYCLVMLCIGLSIGIIISTIELFISYKLWWIIPLGIYAIITVISFIIQVSRKDK